MDIKKIEDMTEPELRDYLYTLGNSLEEILPPGPSKKGKLLFTVLLFDESCIAQYLSNANRQDMIKVLRETADRLDAKEDITR
jgi:hypothetical protein